MNFEKRKELEERCLKIIPNLKKQIRKYVYDYNDQCDILQESFIVAWQKINELKEPYNVEGWMMQITKNKCRAWLNVKQRMLKLNPEKSFIEEEIDESEHFSISEYENLIQGINQLSFPLRKVIQMKYFTHNSINEISKLLCLPLGTVKRRLHDARKKLKKEFGMKEGTKKPEIILKKEPQQNLMINRLGFGLNFGSPLAGVGDVEIYDAFEYPGRIFVNQFCSEVTRKSIIMGKEVLEVRDKSTIKKNKTEKYFYYHSENGKLSMPFRVLNFPQNLKVDIEQEELLSPQECSISTGEYYHEKANEFGVVDLVDIILGEITIKNVMRERYSCDDFHGRCYIEKYYNQDGREILHRNFIGEEWKMGEYITWEKWKNAPEVEFNKEKFRLWFEFILVDNYRKDVK